MLHPCRLWYVLGVSLAYRLTKLTSGLEAVSIWVTSVNISCLILMTLESPEQLSSKEIAYAVNDYVAHIKTHFALDAIRPACKISFHLTLPISWQTRLI